VVVFIGFEAYTAMKIRHKGKLRRQKSVNFVDVSTFL